MYNPYRLSRFWEPPEPLSILEMVNTGTLDLKTAALLWLIMEQRSSVIVSAGPNFAGKTTTLYALLDFLPPDLRYIRLHGYYQDFSFTEDARPAETYMIVEEFNTYMDYVWGETAITAFKLLARGYSMGGTIHARTPQEVIYLFHHYLDLPLALVSQIDAVVNLRITWDGNRYEPLRQIESICLLLPEDDAVYLEVLALLQTGNGEMVFQDTRQIGEAFKRKYNTQYQNIGNEISIREKYLEQLMIDLKFSRRDVKEAIIDFYKSRES